MMVAMRFSLRGRASRCEGTIDWLAAATVATAVLLAPVEEPESGCDNEPVDELPESGSEPESDVTTVAEAAAAAGVEAIAAMVEVVGGEVEMLGGVGEPLRDELALDLVRSTDDTLSELEELLYPVRWSALVEEEEAVLGARWCESSSLEPLRLAGGEKASSSMSPSFISPKAS